MQEVADLRGGAGHGPSVWPRLCVSGDVTDEGLLGRCAQLS